MEGKVIVIFILIHAELADAALSFANYYGDHMVLQQAPKKNMIWGYANEAQVNIEVELTGHPPVQTTSYLDPFIGSIFWKVMLPPEKGPRAFDITVTSENEAIQMTDVLFGDLWLCSGQSNMRFVLSKAFNASKEIADADHYPSIRVFKVAEEWSLKEEYDVTVDKPWSRASKDSVSDFSAVCWLYGKHLYQKLNYPIGLIASTLGGTPIRAWSSKRALDACQHGTGTCVTCNGQLKHEQMHRGNTKPVWQPSVLWNAMIKPLTLLTIYGVIWYQGEFDSMEPDMYAIYKCRFSTMIRDWRHRFYTSSNKQTDGNFPFGFVQHLVDCTSGAVNTISDYICNLAFRWTFDNGNSQFIASLKSSVFSHIFTDDQLFKRTGSVQKTERNKRTYERLREKTNNLASWKKDPSIVTGFPDIRWHQTADFGYSPNPEMTGTFMAVAMDLPDFNSPFKSIHIRDKQDVATRLALSGLSVAYNMDVGKFQGPRITALSADVGFYKITIELDEGKSPIEVRSKDGFELCCSRNEVSTCDGTDSEWLPFPISTHTESTLTLNYANGCAHQWIVGIRYAWRESPCDFKQCAVYSVENSLPMSPFRLFSLINAETQIKLRTDEHSYM